MLIVGIDGSLPSTRDVASNLLLEAVDEAYLTARAFDPNAKVDIFRLKDLHFPVHPGTTCDQVVSVHESLTKLEESLCKADAIIFGTPVYNGGPGSLIVGLFEWLDIHEFPGFSFCGKSYGIVTHFHECGASQTYLWIVDRCTHHEMTMAPGAMVFHQRGFAERSEGQWQLMHRRVGRNVVRQAQQLRNVNWD